MHNHENFAIAARSKLSHSLILMCQIGIEVLQRQDCFVSLSKLLIALKEAEGHQLLSDELEAVIGVELQIMDIGSLILLLHTQEALEGLHRDRPASLRIASRMSCIRDD